MTESSSTNHNRDPGSLGDQIDFSQADHYPLIIVGAGPAGYTAALYAARADLDPLLFQGPEPGGQLMTTTDVENYPGFPDGVLGPDMMEKFEEQAKRFGASVRYGSVTAVDFSERPFRVVVYDEEPYLADALVIASGASPRYLGLDQEEELMGYGLSTCATCDGAFHKDNKVVVVGGGDSAMEEAIFLTRFAKKVYLVHRREELRASQIMQKRAQNNEKIEFLYNTELVELKGDRESGVTGVTMVSHPEGYPKRRYEDDDDDVEVTELSCGGVFYAIGHTPNTEYLEGTDVAMDDEGYVETLEGRTSKTNVDGVFVAGDVTDRRYKQAVTAAGMGCMAAMDAEEWLGHHHEERAKDKERRSQKTPV